MTEIAKKEAELIRKEYETVKHILPVAFHEIAVLIGAESALKLVSVFGGRLLEITQGRTQSARAKNENIARVIGEKNASILVEAFWNTRQILIPSCYAANRNFRNIEIVRQYGELTRHLSDPDAVRELSLRHKLNTRTIYRILKNTF